MIRKFYLILCSVMAIALFITGIACINIKASAVRTSPVISDRLNTSASDSDKSKPDKNVQEPNTAVRTAYNILLLIPDKSSSNTDVMILFNYSPDSGKISLLSIPRDTRVNINTAIPKINSVYSMLKLDRMYEVVDELLGIKPDYYMFIDLKGFRKIVDALGGVDFNIPVDIDYDDPTQDLSIHFKKGLQHLDGEEAEEFLRYRKTQDDKYTKEMLKYYDGSDTKRTEMQVSFMKEFIRQKARLSNLTKVNKILDITADNVKTDIPLDVMFTLSKSVLSQKAFDMNTFRLSGVDSWIKKIYYYIYTEKITNTSTGKAFDGAEIISEYFAVFQ